MAVVAGAVAQRPGVPGHAWVFLNWVLGLRAAGFDVVVVDRLEPCMLERSEVPAERSGEWAWFRRVVETAGLDDAAAVLVDGGRQALGMTRAELLRRCERAVVLFNIMGFLDDAEILAAVQGPRVFVDIDPGFPQMWNELGLCDPFAGHDAFVTVGLGVGSADSTVPTCGHDWITTLPPVDLGAWPELGPAQPQGKLRVSDIATWRGPFGPVAYRGTTYGLRVHELRRYRTLPASFPAGSFEMALAIDPDDAADASALTSGGWQLRDPSGWGLDQYRQMIVQSDVELTVAKQMYVRSRSGWFSDRSACYLASGRAVVAQDTGFSNFLPTGTGLLSFTAPDEAVEALQRVDGDRNRHRMAARRLAEEHLDAGRVLRRLTDRLGVR